MANQRMNAPEDRGLFPQLLVLGQLGRTDARQASAASRWKHHLTKWQCTESDGLTEKGPYFARNGPLLGTPTQTQWKTTDVPLLCLNQLFTDVVGADLFPVMSQDSGNKQKES